MIVLPLVMGAIAGNNLTNIAESPNDSSQIVEILAGEQILISWIAAVATAAGALVTLITYIYKKKQDKLNGLMEVLKLLNDNSHRNARRRVIRLYGLDENQKLNLLHDMGAIDKNKSNAKILASNNQTESENIVKGDFEQVGVLVKEGLVPEQEFLAIYWYKVLKTWMVLEESGRTKKEKDLFFADLMNRAEIYRGKHHYEEVTLENTIQYEE
jgi:hypothetical protein